MVDKTEFEEWVCAHSDFLYEWALEHPVEVKFGRFDSDRPDDFFVRVTRRDINGRERWAQAIVGAMGEDPNPDEPGGMFWGFLGALTLARSMEIPTLAEQINEVFDES